MNMPESLKIYFDAQLVDLYKKSGPSYAADARDDEVYPESVWIAQLILRTESAFSANYPLNSMNFKITAPNPINSSGHEALNKIGYILGGPYFGTPSAGEKTTKQIISSPDVIYVMAATNSYDNTTALAFTPMTLLTELAGQTIHLDAGNRHYMCIVPSNQDELLAITQRGYLVFNIEE